MELGEREASVESVLAAADWETEKPYPDCDVVLLQIQLGFEGCWEAERVLGYYHDLHLVVEMMIEKC